MCGFCGTFRTNPPLSARFGERLRTFSFTLIAARALPSRNRTGDAPVQAGVHMPNRHRGSPPSDPSSAPESGTVRDQNDAPQETEEQQYKRPPKRQSNAPDQRGSERAKSGTPKQAHAK